MGLEAERPPAPQSQAPHLSRTRRVLPPGTGAPAPPLWPCPGTQVCLTEREVNTWSPSPQKHCCWCVALSGPQASGRSERGVDPLQAVHLWFFGPMHALLAWLFSHRGPPGMKPSRHLRFPPPRPPLPHSPGHLHRLSLPPRHQPQLSLLIQSLRCLPVLCKTRPRSWVWC